MPKKKKTRPVVLAVSSGGGHWVQLCRLLPAFSGAEIYFATPDASSFEVVGKSRVHVFPDANGTTPLRLILCFAKLTFILLRLRPDVVVSTGAAGGFLAIKLARLIGARTMFIDSIANSEDLSISGRLSLGVADRVLSQWPSVAARTGAEYCGAVI